MCGIYCSIRVSSADATGQCVDAEVFGALSEQLRTVNGVRGPDAQTLCTLRLPVSYPPRNPSKEQARSGELRIEFFASELLLRGRDAVVQPHQQEGDVFCWNGEVFEGLDINPEENDGAKLFGRLRLDCTPDSVPSLLGSVEGPYAFVFYDSSSEKLYFARDPLGRRSLLIHRPSPSGPYFLLSSVSAGDHPAYQFEELPTEGIFCLDVGLIRQSSDGLDDCLSTIPRRASAAKFAEISRVNTAHPPEDIPLLDPFECEPFPKAWSDAVDEFIAHLDRSVMLRVRDIPVHFGQEGKARVAVLFSGGIDSTMLAFLAHRHVPGDEAIDLINVAFENPRKIQVRLGGNSDMLPKRERKKCRKAGEILKVTNGGTTSYLVPDRVTGLEEVDELRKLCPGRTWNFVEVDVPYEESLAARSAVEAIMWPSRTVMDLSLAMALYFASRGVGRIRGSTSECYKAYTSHARVLLNGLGSDELLGGYGRHRTAFTVGGWNGVIDELQLELDRIPTRNLGRDDRIISSHGKETRHPFLSLSVVSFLAGLPVYLKLDPRLDVGKGDKTLLRLAARRVGLVEASARKKRAMQFGSHSARMTAGEGERRGDLVIR
ncbi:asparagine synthase-domain-containing protein [Pisolithus croceorrhizus]|nr:asparagine synthase-domain-containing protein [Pisolithus croceorrhizus]